MNRVASATLGDFITRKSRGLERGLTGLRGCYARELCVAAQRHAHLFAQLLIHPARRCWNGYRRACRISVRPALKQFGTIGAARPYQHGRQSPVPGPPVRERGLVNRHLLEASSLRGPVPCDHPQAGRPPGARTHPGLGPGDFSRPLAGRSRLANGTSRTVPGIFPIGSFCVAAASRKLPVCSGGYWIIVGARRGVVP